MRDNKYVPYYDRRQQVWKVQFKDRDAEFGELSYVVSEYLRDGLIYEYDILQDGVAYRNHEHSFNGILAAVIRDVKDGFQISFDRYLEEYSPQELDLLTKLMEKLKKDIAL